MLIFRMFVTFLSVCGLQPIIHGQIIQRIHTFDQDGQKLEITISGGPSGAGAEEIFLMPGHFYEVTATAKPSAQFWVTNPLGGKGQDVRVPPHQIDLTGQDPDPPAPIMAQFDDGATNENNTITITVPCSVVEVLAVPPAEIQDGLPSAQFSVAVHPPGVTVDSWLWEWEPLNDAADRLPPDPYFDDPEKQNPIVSEAWWHSESGSSLIKGDQGDPQDGAPNDRAIHRIRCTVNIQGSPFETEWVHWNVFVFKQSPGVAPPDIEGSIPIANIVVEELQGSGNHIATLSPNGPENNPFTRTAPTLHTGDMVPDNSFWNKIVTVHEGVHLDQWTNEESEWFPLYQPVFLWNEIREMSAEGSSPTNANGNLRVAVRTSGQKIYHNWEEDRISTWWKRELEAHGESNPIDPPFLNSNLTHWIDDQPQPEGGPSIKGELWPIQ